MNKILENAHASSFRKIRFFALSCKNANLSGIRFACSCAKKPNRIPHKFSFAQKRARKKILRNDEAWGYLGDTNKYQ
jgi:hypothetical protein